MTDFAHWGVLVRGDQYLSNGTKTKFIGALVVKTQGGGRGLIGYVTKNMLVRRGLREWRGGSLLVECNFLLIHLGPNFW